MSSFFKKLGRDIASPFKKGGAIQKVFKKGGVIAQGVPQTAVAFVFQRE